MQIKYKCRDDSTEEVFTNIKGYLLDEDANVQSILLTDGTERAADNLTFNKFLETIDGHDVYEYDKAEVIITEKVYEDYPIEPEETERKVKGVFVELYEEGLYYILEDETEEIISYIASNTKILSLK